MLFRGRFEPLNNQFYIYRFSCFYVYDHQNCVVKTNIPEDKLNGGEGPFWHMRGKHGSVSMS